MKSILNLLQQPPARVSADELTFDGTALTSLSDREYNRIKGQQMSIIFQSPMSSLNPVYTVGEQLVDTAQFGGGRNVGPLSYLYGKHLSDDREAAREQVIEMLEEVQLPDPVEIMDSYPTQLSGGMQQRVLIAQALLNEPELLIADEIGTALDVTIHDQILELLMDLIDQHDLSVLMITHNLGVAREVSDRIYVMYGGDVVETAPTADLFDDPRHPYTQGLIGSIPRLTGEHTIGGIDGTVPDYLDPPDGCRFRARCPYAHERCRREKPDKYGSDQSGAACFLYDDREQPPHDPPSLDDIEQIQTDWSNVKSETIQD
jgi:peptide/nickel transport system ATP-binding protein